MTKTAAVPGKVTGKRKAKGVELASGQVLEADILIAATGVKPNLYLLDGSGIERGWGIRVDDHLRTNVPDVYAAGDAVEVADRLTGETFVHAIFPNAVEQGHVVGLNLVGYESLYEGGERMNSLKHLDLPIMAVGLKDGDEILQEKQNGHLRTIYLKENRVVGFQLGETRTPRESFERSCCREVTWAPSSISCWIQISGMAPWSTRPWSR